MAAALARWAGPALLQLRPAVSVTGGSRALSSFQPEAPGLVSNLEAKAVQELRRLMEDQAAKPAAAGEAEGGAQQSAELESVRPAQRLPSSHMCTLPGLHPHRCSTLELDGAGFRLAGGGFRGTRRQRGGGRSQGKGAHPLRCGQPAWTTSLGRPNKPPLAVASPVPVAGEKEPSLGPGIATRWLTSG